MAFIFGSTGAGTAEIISGGVENDTIDHLGGSDLVEGGGGFDTLLFYDVSSNYTIVSLAGFTRITGGPSAVDKYRDQVVFTVNLEQLRFSDRTIRLNPSDNTEIFGAALNGTVETITGTEGNDSIDHLGGSDTIDGKAGDVLKENLATLDKLAGEQERGQVRELRREFDEYAAGFEKVLGQIRAGKLASAAEANAALDGIVATMPHKVAMAAFADEVLETGRYRFVYHPTPHLPHGWDMKTPEQWQPREWYTHEGKRVVWEACQTLSGSWGYHRDETTWKSPEQLVEIQQGGNSEEFLESVKVDLFPDKVYVFTPKSKIMALPKGVAAWVLSVVTPCTLKTERICR